MQRNYCKLRKIPENECVRSVIFSTGQLETCNQHFIFWPQSKSYRDCSVRM